MPSSGRVTELWRHPVKSMGGERVRALRVDERGAGGDRTHAVWWRRPADGQERQLTAREAGGLLRWSARYPGVAEAEPADPPLPTLRAPDGTTHAWTAPGMAERLTQELGRGPLWLTRDVAGQQDLERSLLITVGASLRALEAELGVEVDLRRFRPNVHLELDDAVAPWAELGWEGGRIAFAGGVELELLHPCVRCVIPTRLVDPGSGELERWPALLRHLARAHDTCFGINARVVVPGRIETDESVSVTTPR